MFLTVVENEKRHFEALSQIFKGLNITIQDVSPMKNIKTVFESMKNEMMRRVEVTKDELEAFKIAMQIEKKGLNSIKRLYQRYKQRKRNLSLRGSLKKNKSIIVYLRTHTFSSQTQGAGLCGKSIA